MLAALGPIQARFAGTAQVEYRPDHTGRVSGEGKDRFSGTRLTAKAGFALSADGPNATMIDLTMPYALRPARPTGAAAAAGAVALVVSAAVAPPAPGRPRPAPGRSRAADKRTAQLRAGRHMEPALVARAVDAVAVERAHRQPRLMMRADRRYGVDRAAHIEQQQRVAGDFGFHQATPTHAGGVGHVRLMRRFILHVGAGFTAGAGSRHPVDAAREFGSWIGAV